MEIFVCPKGWTHATDRFVPEHLLSLQNPDAEIDNLRPPWVSAENHHIAYLRDIESATDESAPSREKVLAIIKWLQARCGADSKCRLMIHCDAGLGRSPAVGYIAWSIHLGPGREPEAFARMQQSCLHTMIIPNLSIIAHADEILGRNGALKKPLAEWNETLLKRLANER